MTAAPSIHVEGIEKSFKDVHVLRGVDFDVKAGSIFALLGSNGAGKTTLVRILSTLLKADAGSATVHEWRSSGIEVLLSPICSVSFAFGVASPRRFRPAARSPSPTPT